MDTLSLNMRAIQTEIRAYQSYEFSPLVTRVLNLAHTKEGLILVTGITGSGKSSTLDAIVDLNFGRSATRRTGAGEKPPGGYPALCHFPEAGACPGQQSCSGKRSNGYDTFHQSRHKE
ncbi:hypothetical protein B1H10_04205 [candidate division KSB1 bacterium 4484_188]|nr:MAG: hypothetical protein B1H10_04205 [candidate division KSB1 bacterium 4484_188]